MSINENGAGVQRVRHNKTGNIYRVLAHATITTNWQDGQRAVVYCPDDEENTIYVREEKEFYDKFSELNIVGRG